VVDSIRIVYDNRTLEGFIPDWGFSAFIESDFGNILFDTGARGEVLKENMDTFGISPSDVDMVFISHNHWDHVGGLGYICSQNGDVEVFVPEDDCEEFESSIPESAVCVPISSPTQICEHAVSTGIMSTGLEKPSHEQSLIVKTEKGPVLITGCSHPGIVNIARVAYEISGERLYLTVGGFHLFRSFEPEIVDVAEKLKEFSLNVAPCHCTGDLAISLFKRLWGDRFIEAEAGSEMLF